MNSADHESKSLSWIINFLALYAWLQTILTNSWHSPLWNSFPSRCPPVTGISILWYISSCPVHSTHRSSRHARHQHQGLWAILFQAPEKQESSGYSWPNVSWSVISTDCCHEESLDLLVTGRPRKARTPWKGSFEETIKVAVHVEHRALGLYIEMRSSFEDDIDLQCF